MWNTYTKESSVKLPYLLDGIVFTPQNQIYTRSFKEIKFKTYKWKPPENNSIDFYIELEKSRETNNVLNVYDDTNEESVKGKNFQILNLHLLLLNWFQIKINSS